MRMAKRQSSTHDQARAGTHQPTGRGTRSAAYLGGPPTPYPTGSYDSDSARGYFLRRLDVRMDVRNSVLWIGAAATSTCLRLVTKLTTVTK